MVAHAFKPTTQETEEVGLCESEVSLVYRARARTARATTQRNKNKTEEPRKVFPF